MGNFKKGESPHKEVWKLFLYPKEDLLEAIVTVIWHIILQKQLFMKFNKDLPRIIIMGLK